MIKCVVIGDPDVGKSSFLLRFRTGKYSPNNIDSHNTLSDSEWSIWDIKGATSKPLRIAAYKNTDVFLICFEDGNEKSFYNALSVWLLEANSACPSAVAVFVALKSDTNPLIKVHFDYSWRCAATWPTERRKMRFRYNTWKMAKVTPLFKKRQSPKEPPKDQRNLFETLPDEVILVIIKYLNTPDLVNFSLTCKNIHRIAQDRYAQNGRVLPKSYPNIQNYLCKQLLTNFVFSQATCSALTGEGVHQVFQVALKAHQFNIDKIHQSQEDKGKKKHPKRFEIANLLRKSSSIRTSVVLTETTAATATTTV